MKWPGVRLRCGEERRRFCCPVGSDEGDYEQTLPLMDDHVLLSRFVDEGANEAFTALVQRHLNLVYFAALRQTGGDAALAEDIAQGVFADLARKAATLRGRPALAGWLYTSTRYAAANALRTERRRRAREQEAYVMQEVMRNEETATDWDRLRPVIDDALHGLNETDREAVLLRFFEGRAFAEIGSALRLTEEAARKRVDRALDKMAAMLARRGVTSTSAAVGAAMAAQAAVAAPSGLAASVAGTALSGAAAVGAAATGAGIIGFMASLKTTLIASTAAVLGIGAAVYQNRVANQRDHAWRTEVHARERAESEMAGLKQQLAAAEKRAQAAEEDNAKLLAAIRSQSAARTAAGDAIRATAKEPLTRDQVEARYRRAQELAKTGDPAEALKELLWCFDEGMVGVASYGGVRRSFLLSVIGKLGEKHPPALQALRTRRDQAQRRLMISETDYDAVADFGAINRVLKDDASTLAMMDTFPPGDRRRKSLASSALEELVAQRRYEHAMEARTYDQMVQFFGSLKSNATSDERKKSTVEYVAKYVEILAGAGQTTQAKEFAQQVLAFHPTPDTRAAIERHAARAGHGDLLNGL